MFNKKHFELYRKLIQLRKENPVLSFGSFKFLVNEGKKLGYTRSDEANEIIVFFNLENSKSNFELPEGDFIDLLTGKKFENRSIILKPMEAVVLKKIN